MPKRREDAELLYGGDESTTSPTSGSNRPIQYCTVIEILKDEAPILGSDRQGESENQRRQFGWREGKWTAIELDGAGLRFVDAFEEKGGMNGMGMTGSGSAVGKMGNATRGLGNGVSNIAKIWGFGGRRV